MADELTGLARAVSVAKGQLPLAKRIGVAQSSVWEWLNRSKRGVPAEHVLKVEAATGVSRHELRPDLYPPPASAPHAPATTEATAA